MSREQRELGQRTAMVISSSILILTMVILVGVYRLALSVGDAPPERAAVVLVGASLVRVLPRFRGQLS